METTTNTRKIRAIEITDDDFTLCCCWMCKHCVLDLGRGYLCTTDDHVIGGNVEIHINRSHCIDFKRN